MCRRSVPAKPKRFNLGWLLRRPAARPGAADGLRLRPLSAKGARVRRAEFPSGQPVLWRARTVFRI
jgi:hypothetical protein